MGTSNLLWSAWQTAWLTWAGCPQIVYVDQERGFAGYFSEQCVQLSIQVKPTPGEAHNQAGRIENQSWKDFRIE